MSAVSPSIGQTLGKYRILEQVGAGGMGIVFRARDERLSRDVAIKVLPPGAITDEVARKRFRKEALALSRLNHPNIVTVFDFDDEHGVDFLVSEYVSGSTLDRKLVGGPLPEQEIISLGKQLAQGLHAAHAQGVIHRDLKPGNLRLTNDGRLKILDFGLAMLLQPADDAHLAPTLTKSDSGGGTLPYMPPEQLRGEHTDERADIYAAGAVLYELATGSRPFPETQGPRLTDDILHRIPGSPSKLNPRISRGLDSIILKTLEKVPARRFQSAGELLVALEHCGDPTWTAPVPAKKSKSGIRCRRNQVLVVVAVLLVALVVTHRARAGHWWRKPAVPAQKYLAVLPFRSVEDNSEQQMFARGLTETTSTRLMQLAGQSLQVASPSEVQALKIAGVEDARKQLGINLVLEGSMERSSDRVRVNLRLVDANTRLQVGGESVTAETSDLFNLEDQVVQAAARMLEVELHKNQQGGGEKGTINPWAYDLYVSGRGYLQNSDRPENIDSAIGELSQAIKLDPGYAAAHAMLGEAYWNKYLSTKDRQFVQRVKDECAHSLALNRELAEGHVCLGMLNNGLGQYQIAASELQLAVKSDPTDDVAYRQLASAYESMGSMEQAEQTYKHALEIRTQDARTYSFLANLYRHEARYDDAAQQLEKAVAVSPDRADYWSGLGGVYVYAGRYQDAIKALNRAIQIRPSYDSYSNLGQAYFTLRQFPEAINAFEQAVARGNQEMLAHGNLARAYYWYSPTRSRARKHFLEAIRLADEALEVNPNNADAHTLSAQYCAMVGDRTHALRHMTAALHLEPNDAETFFFAAMVYNQLGDRSQALQWLEKAVNKGYSPAEIARTIELDSLRNEPRFKALLAKEN